MICPRCKNDKWDEDICPKCGLNEKEALLVAAEIFRKEGKNISAVDLYDKYLRLDPDRLDVMRKRANCLGLEAISRHNDELLEKANKALKQALEIDWNWEIGHQLRVDLFFRYGKLEDLQNEYSVIGQQIKSRKDISLNVIKIILLTKKFDENPPDGLTTLTQAEEWILLTKSFWPLLLGLPFLLWGVFKFSSLPHSKEGSNAVVLFFVLMIFCLMVLILFFISMKIYRRNKNVIKRDNKIAQVD